MPDPLPQQDVAGDVALDDLLDPKPTGVVQCDSCGQFVSVAKAYWDTEYGDYGQVYSSVPFCRRCEP